jgi:hypothetical protein
MRFIVSIASVVLLAAGPAAGKNFDPAKGEPFQVRLSVHLEDPPAQESDTLVLAPGQTALLQHVACSIGGVFNDELLRLEAGVFEGGTQVGKALLLEPITTGVLASPFGPSMRSVSSDELFACVGESCDSLDGTTYGSLLLTAGLGQGFATFTCVVSGWLF